MFKNKQFTITEPHLKLIRHMEVDYNDECEFGAPEIDPKRPYGNSDVYKDIAEILGLMIPDEDEGDEWSAADIGYMDRLHRETATALQIVLRTGEFRTGHYEASAYGSDWRLVE